MVFSKVSKTFVNEYFEYFSIKTTESDFVENRVMKAR